MTPAQRQEVAKELKNRVFGNEDPDVREAGQMYSLPDKRRSIFRFYFEKSLHCLTILVTNKMQNSTLYPRVIAPLRFPVN